ncbi:Uncharacterised protein [Vibrio cholerae]|nr:Uncharacterised protein [Vibrio cholerae]CSD06514.1 Uncharacterised protein [Vibrio cholerae]CSD08201.1 Uncharacterised protein [Vibrio cholerae]CSD19072.1 Uncharacterised protein [Vibrio cholerae]
MMLKITMMQTTQFDIFRQLVFWHLGVITNEVNIGKSIQ